VIDHVIREAARRFGDTVAFVDPDGAETTYAELDDRSDEVAVGLVHAGITPGDVIALTLPSVTAYVVAYAGAAKVGAITAGINPRLAPPERAAILATADPALVLGSVEEVDDLRRPGTAPRLDHEPSTAVALVFTSGTTGTPKGALFANRQLSAVTAIDVGDRWGGGGPMLASTQFAHVGFMTKLPWYLRLGTTTHILGRWRPGDALRVIAEQRITSIGGVAPQIALMLRAPELDQLDLSAVETIVMGGGPSPPALVDEARRRFDASYSIRWSSTESGGCGTGTAFDAPDDEALFTVGKPRGGIEIEIRGDAGEAVGQAEVGEVWLRSPTTMEGYWRDADGTAAALVDGWLRTGDLGRIDDDGNLRLAGRLKEMFIRGGYNVYPMEIEAVLADHPAVAELAVVPRPDEVMGEVGVAVVVPRDRSAPPTLSSLRAHLEGRVARYKLPEAIRIVDALPLTPMQKVDRRALADAERPPV
jgi:acyl-CoA synthetase (AMP-forming)/AMP-acid ligase II